MQEFTQEQFDAAFDSLPDTVKDAILSPQNNRALRALAADNGLSRENFSELAETTSFVLAGLVHPKEYIPRLATRLGLPIEKIRSVAQEVNEQIFRSVRDELKTIHGIEGSPALKKPLDAELEEQAGIRRPEPPKPPTAGRPLVKDLEAALGNASKHVKLQEPGRPSAPSKKTILPTEELAAPLPAKPQGLDFSAPMMIKTYARDIEMAEKEENLTKEEILKGIEDPSSLATPKPPTPEPPQYKADPYREPLE